jgi:hypothetical protein
VKKAKAKQIFDTGLHWKFFSKCLLKSWNHVFSLEIQLSYTNCNLYSME